MRRRGGNWNSFRKRREGSLNSFFGNAWKKLSETPHVVSYEVVELRWIDQAG
jgi:hypothetical protein